MNTVELRPAYAWDCEKCGRENFARGIVVELSEEEMAEMRDDHGVQPWEEGNWMMMPTTVTCVQCLTLFDTKHFNEDEESE